MEVATTGLVVGLGLLVGYSVGDCDRSVGRVGNNVGVKGADVFLVGNDENGWWEVTGFLVGESAISSPRTSIIIT